MVRLRVVVRVVHHVAVTLARSSVALPVGVAAVIEARLELAKLAEVARLAHAPRHRVLNGAVAVEGAVGLAVLDAAVVPDHGWRTHALAKAVADAIYLPLINIAG